MRPDQSSARGARVVLTTLAVALVAAIAATPASAAPSTGLVVNEVYGGGGNSGATYTNDFVEIANRDSSPVDVSGWSVQYHAATGTGAWQVTPLSGSIAPGQLYLVAEAAGAGGTTPLPTPQVTGTIPMAAASGTIALVNGTAALTCQDSAACQSASVDLVGYGSTAAINESAPAPGGSSTASLQRNGTTDTDNNSTDFAAATPTPAGANDGGGGPGTGTPGPLRIHDIQGATWISPHDDVAGDQRPRHRHRRAVDR